MQMKTNLPLDSRTIDRISKSHKRHPSGDSMHHGTAYPDGNVSSKTRRTAPPPSNGLRRVSARRAEKWRNSVLSWEEGKEDSLSLQLCRYFSLTEKDR